jgi:putative flippase GtrA
MTRKKVEIATLYTLFAAFSTAINICTQMISIWLYKGLYAVEVSILMGTAISFPLRYFLEKRYIFAFKTKKISQDGQLFALYSLMSIFTTAIFWIWEYSFQLVWGTDTMRYIGGVIGLTIGFYVKYYLDKKYVFIEYGYMVKL